MADLDRGRATLLVSEAALPALVARAAEPASPCGARAPDREEKTPDGSDPRDHQAGCLREDLRLWAEAGKYTFRVHDDAHKTQIRQAIEQLFDV